MTFSPQDEDPAAEHQQRHNASQAALFMLILGIAGLLFSGCFATLCAMIISGDPAVDEALAEQFSPAQIQQVQSVMPAILVGIGLLGGLPSLAYLILSFPVRRRGRISATISLVLVVTQTIVIAVMLLQVIVQALFQTQPMQATVGVFLFGTPLALLIWTGLLLLRVLTGRGGGAIGGRPMDLSRDPWSHEPEERRP